MRLTELGSLGDDDQGDCYVRPRIEGVSLLDFDKFDELVVGTGEHDAGPRWTSGSRFATKSCCSRIVAHRSPR